jgi:hypothetical protein
MRRRAIEGGDEAMRKKEQLRRQMEDEEDGD